MVRKATVHIEPDGCESRLSDVLSAEAITQAIKGLDGERAVTLTITPEGVDERLLVAVDGSHAFVGLERPDGLLQFAVGGRDASATRPFNIGGQEADIEIRYLLDLQTAATVVVEWLAEGEQSAVGVWERQ
jgi:hypothetical protein